MMEKETRKKTGKEQQTVQLLVFALFPVAAFYLMETYEHNPFVKVRPQAQIFNIMLFEFIGWILYLVIGRLRPAAHLVLGSAMVFGLVNHYVMRFRSTPFVPWDVYSVGTAVSVADNYDFTPGIRVTFVTLGFAALFLLAQFCLRKGQPLGARFRLPVAAAAAVGLGLFTGALQDEQFQLRHYLYPYLFTPVYMTEVNGMAVTFAMNLQYLAVKKPDGYDAQKEQEILESYETIADSITQDEKAYPNIIVIMDEAFSDLAVLGEFASNVDYMPFVHSLQQGAENTVTGYVQVSVCGGNTANSEFEFLTGNTMAFLPGGSIPYQQYIKREIPSLASHLGTLGYQTYAQHPYYASGWSRESVYPLLGFSDMDFLNDYPTRNYVRKYISDACDFRHIIATFENREQGQPLFLFNVTMQNHGGYTEVFDNFANDVTAGLGSSALDQYLSLVRLTDESLQELVEYFSQVEEPTIILFFGDHQPNDSVVRPVWETNGVDPSQLTDQQQLARYQVPYVIWANYDIQEGAGQDTSLNYLGARLLSIAGVPAGAYQNYLLTLQQTCPKISAAGTSVISDGELQDQAESGDVLDAYERLQYYMLFGNASQNEKVPDIQEPVIRGGSHE